MSHTACAAALLALAVGCVFAGPALAAGATVPASQSLVTLLQDHTAFSNPSEGARPIETVRARRPLTRVRTVLPAVGRATSSDGASWVHVLLPGRPNGRTGWILASNTRAGSTGWHIRVGLSTRRVTAYHDGRVERRFRAVVGARSTPTPRGRFFIEEGVAISRRDVGGPFALATSARSNVLQAFAGGPGQIALHGVGNLPSVFGTAASHGCIRISNPDITWLARRIGGGIPLTITR